VDHTKVSPVDADSDLRVDGIGSYQNPRVVVEATGEGRRDVGLLRVCIAVFEKALFDIVHVITVPLTLPLDAVMPEAEAMAAQALERVMAVARNSGIRAEAHIVRHRERIPGLLSMARATGAIALVIGVPWSLRGWIEHGTSSVRWWR
jgi:hypothetical protein